MAVEAGATVWLKTGGLPMTVKSQMAFNTGWMCHFFDGEGKFYEIVFLEEQLLDYDPNNSDRRKDFTKDMPNKPIGS